MCHSIRQLGCLRMGCPPGRSNVHWWILVHSYSCWRKITGIHMHYKGNREICTTGWYCISLGSWHAFICLIWFFTFLSTIFQLCPDGSSCVEPVLRKNSCDLLKDTTQWRCWGSEHCMHSCKWLLHSVLTRFTGYAHFYWNSISKH